MRTDVKIGVAVGLLFVIAVVSYYAIFDRGGATDPNKPDQLARGDGAAGPDAKGAAAKGTSAKAAADKGASGGPAAKAGKKDGPSLPRFGSLSPAPATPPIERREPPSVPTIREGPSLPETPATPSIRETPTVPEMPVIPSIPATPVVTPVREPPSIPEITRGPEAPVVPSIREMPVIPSIREITPVTPAEGADRERTYTVQKGDSGFWAIAEKVYGDGRQWTLIAKANPDADSNALRPGKVLRIPAKLVAPAAGPGPSTPAATGLVVTASGQREYIVKQGDSGFWGIAQTVYGNGKHWALIAKANPQANSGSLQPGMKLVIPPAPAEVPPTAAGPGPGPGPTPGPVTAIALGPGQKLYVVIREDISGYWGIAKKAYGDGKYWPLIAKANPRAASGTLKAGQQLIIPELTEEARREAERAGPTGPATSAAPIPRRTDVEDLGPRPRFRR